MPTKRTFDMVVVTVLLINAASGLVKLTSRRWIREESGPLAFIGQVVQTAA